MHLINKQFKTSNNSVINYYETDNNKPILLIIHAQGTDATSYSKVTKDLSKSFHLILVDCYGHGKSSHNNKKYNIVSQGNDLIEFIQTITSGNISILGHSSGGLIAAYIASKTDLCGCLILEDPPFFSSQGERRKNTFNYVDLSTVCHNFINQTDSNDFVLYYFSNQYAWNLFPDKSRDKIKSKTIEIAAKYRQKHPGNNLKVMFWPKAALSSFRGMNNYDPLFGEAFYNDSFHNGIPHAEILKNIKCRTVFMKAKTNVSENGILMAALSEDDLKKVSELIDDCQIVRFDCGHGIHIEKPREFVKSLVKLK